MEEKLDWVNGMNGMHLGILENLNDEDLSFNPGGRNMTMGALCRQNGEIEYSYLQSLKTFKQDWSYRNSEDGLESSISKLKIWYQKLDDEMKNLLSILTEEDLKKPIERFNHLKVPIHLQIDIYIQAQFIFLGKAVIYLNAMNKSLPPSVQEYIG